METLEQLCKESIEQAELDAQQSPTDLAWQALCEASAQIPKAVISYEHPFTNTLGKGPYSFEGLSHGTSACAHCGKHIKNIYSIKIGSGEIKPVGSECILKLAHSDTASLVRQVKTRKAKYDALKRAEAKAKKRERERQENLAVFQEQAADVVGFLTSYEGNSGFINSLKNQLATFGALSTRQVECVRDTIKKANEPKPVREYSLKVGETIIITKFIARIIGEKTGLNRPHFALEVVEITAETEKAFRGTFKLSAVRTAHCCVCGALLKNPKSVAAGIGPICGGFYEVDNIEALAEKLRTVIATVTTWIPKSQIKETKKVIE